MEANNLSDFRYYDLLIPSVIQLMLAELIFPVPANRKKWLSLKTVISCIVLYILFDVVNLKPILGEMNTILFRFFLTFIVSVLLFWWSIGGNLGKILFCCLAGLCTQNMAFNIVQLILTVIPYCPIEVFDYLYHIGSLCVFTALYIIVYFVFARKSSKQVAYFNVGGREIIILSAIVVILTVILSWYLDPDYTKTASYISGKLIIVLSEILLLCYQFDLLERNKMLYENHSIEQLWKMDKKRYEMEKDKIEQINEKYHDLKHILKYNEEVLSRL